ncbi:MAG: 50S ribosomal protein L11 methyltransferase [Deltaproteobacteria bacterium]|jgi:ribosomal protein L11 methylase PrmA|nr:50S ribosomal protein L11 methyltransferase [Deltaproteobacteria bacterium]
MRPDTPLTIYEIRCADKESRALFDKADLRAIMGPKLLGYHFEADFAFVFCEGDADIGGLLSSIPGLTLSQVHRLRYDEWQDGANAPPLVIGPLAIYPPSWAGPKAPPPKVSPNPVHGHLSPFAPLVIDPGLAFGYGGHATTKACLSFLLRVYSPQGKGAPKVCLDLGTGTGVLALASARMGAERVLGVDYSHLAIEIARENLAMNQLGDKVSFVYGEAADFASYEAGLVLSNIPLAVHLDLLGKGAYADRRYLILSGLLPSEADTLTKRLLGSYPYKLIDNQRDDRWSSWLLGAE